MNILVNVQLFLLCWLTLIFPTFCRDLECEARDQDPRYPGISPSEPDRIQKWWAEAKQEWQDIFNGDESFELWDEFDLQRDHKLVERIKNLDYNSLECHHDKMPFKLRYDLGFDEDHHDPAMFDWDEKMSKKAIVSAMQPDGEKENWYLDLVYQDFFPYATDEKIDKIIKVVNDWFTDNPGQILFLKGTLGGGTGTSIKWCDSSAKGTAQAMYRLKKHHGLDESIRICMKELDSFIRKYKKNAWEKKERRWVNPAGTFGYPGFLIEPGYVFQVEVKAHAIWGKLFGIGTQTPHACLHTSNGHNGTFERFRGFEGDPRPTREGDKTNWEVMQESKTNMVTDEMLAKVKRISEGIAKHADFARVDIFINVLTGKMVVNEIESYYHVCGYGYVNNKESMRLMARTWVEGWQKLLGRNKLKVIKRVDGRYQDVAPQWAHGEPPEPPEKPPTFPWLSLFCWIVSIVIVGFGGYYLGNKQLPFAGGSQGEIEMRS